MAGIIAVIPAPLRFASVLAMPLVAASMPQ
jgi:hypothetical protein